MEGLHDLVFTATKNSSRERVEGTLYVKATGKKYNAYSGSRSLLPLPNGGYIAKNIRVRDKANMALPVLAKENDGGGMSFPAWSVDIDPLFSSRRSLLRIHPDGNLPGTMGCIGILNSAHECYEDIKNAIGELGDLTLLVNHNNLNPSING